jgi:hypothetical protein
MIPDIMTPDGRRAAAFFAILGGCMVQTVHQGALTWLLRTHAEYLLYLALGNLVLLLVGFTALGWQMGRRMSINAGRDGVTLNDAHEGEG